MRAFSRIFFQIIFVIISSQIFQPWIKNKRKEHEMKKQLMSEIIGHVQRSALGSLFTEDGTPDISAVKR